MKKKSLILMSIVLLVIAAVNICNVFTHVSFFDKNIEAIAKVECSSYERSNYILGKTTEYCNVHKKDHECLTCMNCLEEKCCDTKLETTKPDCWKSQK